MSLPVVTSLLRGRLTAVATTFAVLLWSAAVLAGIQRMWSYESTPGSRSLVPASWPGSALVTLDTERLTLVMFVHPLCACTRASLTELRAALDAMDRAPAVWIVVMNARGVVADWEEKIAAIARRIPEATLVTDADGRAADTFGASTSGHVVVYDRAGQLVFSGGVTGARGHVGDNDGRRHLIAASHDGTERDADEHPIYGCGLDDPQPRQP